MSKLNSRAISS